MPLPRSADLGLNDEQRLLRRTVREFAQEKVAPRAHRIDAEQSFPTESWAEAAELGLLGATVPSRARRRRPRADRALPDRRRAGGGLRLDRGDRPAPGRHGRRPDRPPRQRRAEAALAAGPDRRLPRRLPGDDRARGRLRRDEHADPGRAGRRRLAPERDQDLHHQRPGRRPGAGLRAHAAGRAQPRHVRDPDRDAGLRPRQEVLEDGLARLAHRRAAARRLRRRRRGADRRRGRRPGDPARGPRQRAGAAGGGVGRDRPGGARGGARLRRRAAPVRPADRRVPDDRRQARRHVRRDRGLPGADPARSPPASTPARAACGLSPRPQSCSAATSRCG